MKPTVSVIIPVYNVEKYLCGCLDSLLAQTFIDYEAICVNDGSTDASLTILEEYLEKDRRIHIICHQTNEGQSVARNTGLDSAIGEYIFFLDADDYIHPQALEFMYRCAVENNIDLVHAGYVGSPNLYEPMQDNLLYEKIKKQLYTNPIEAYLLNYKKQLVGLVVTKLYSRKLLEGIRFIPGRLYEEEYFTTLVIEKCVKTIRLDFNMYNYYYGRSDATTYQANEQVLNSHLANIRFLCEHFSYDKKLMQLVKQGKVSTILFKSCLRTFKYLENRCLYEKLRRIFVDHVRALVRDGLINYNDISLYNKYKLYKILAGQIPDVDMLRSTYIYKLGREIWRSLRR